MTSPQIVEIYGCKGVCNPKNYLLKYDPHLLISDYLKERPARLDEDEPFFIFRDRLPVKADQIRRVLKKCLISNGLDSSLYDMHSMRLG